MKTTKQIEDLIEVVWLASIITLGIMAFFILGRCSVAEAQGLAFTEQELACFAKVDALDFVPREVQPRFKIYRGTRGCNSFGCFVSRARPARKALQVFVLEGLHQSSTRVHFGNLGWARQNVALIPNTSTHLENALLIARGVEAREIGKVSPWVIDVALKDHNLFVEEVLCLRKTDRCRASRRQGGQCEISFNEVQPVPAVEVLR
jgi:hypothetical protein